MRLNNLLSAIMRFSDASHGQVELQSTNRQTLLKKANLICLLLTTLLRPSVQFLVVPRDSVSDLPTRQRY